MKANESQNKAPKSILIAEDNSKTRIFLTHQLELMGYNIVGAVSNGQQAVEAAFEQNPNLIIMDIKMPEMDGIQAAKAITSKGSIPIILITGVSSDEMTAKALDSAIEAGVFAYLLKPITKKQLMAAIKLAMVRYEQFSNLRAEVSDLMDAIETRKVVERAKGVLMKKCNISEEDAFKLLQNHSQKENKRMRDIAESILSAKTLI
jgi:AmiR/NasT family two-component response regulator